MELKDLPPAKDPKGGSPKTPVRITVREYADEMQLGQAFDIHSQFWPIAFRSITWMLQLAVLAAVFWVKGNFVTKEEYQRDSKETLKSLNSINISMQHVGDKLDGYELILKKNEELETRMREMEKQQWQTKNHP